MSSRKTIGCCCFTLACCVGVPGASASGTEFSADALIGQNTCDATSKPVLNGTFMPFEKDPSAFSFGDVAIQGKRYVLAIRNDVDHRGCGKVIVAMPIDTPNRKANESIGFNCAVLKQRYARHKSYFGLYETSALEYSQAKIAWVFDFDTEKFAPYKTASKVYCANFIAD